MTKWPNSIPYVWPKQLKNHTLWGHTYLHSPDMGVPPPPGTNNSNWWIHCYGLLSAINNKQTHNFFLLWFSSIAIGSWYQSSIFNWYRLLLHRKSVLKLSACLYNKQNNTWLVVDMEYLFSCSLKEIFHIYVRPCTILCLSIDYAWIYIMVRMVADFCV